MQKDKRTVRHSKLRTSISVRHNRTLWLGVLLALAQCLSLSDARIRRISSSSRTRQRTKMV